MENEKLPENEGQLAIQFAIKDELTLIDIAINHGNQLTPTKLMGEMVGLIDGLIDNYKKVIISSGISEEHADRIIASAMTNLENMSPEKIIEGLVASIVGDNEEKKEEE